MMEAQDSLRANPFAFDNELNNLIFDAVNLDTGPNTEQDAAQQPPGKRLKTGNASQNKPGAEEKDHELVHKRSTILRDRTNISPACVTSSGYNEAKVNFSPIRRRLFRTARHTIDPSEGLPSIFDESSLAKAVQQNPNPLQGELVHEQVSSQHEIETLEKFDQNVPDCRSPKAVHSPSPSIPAPANLSLSDLPQKVLKRIFQFALVRSEPIVIDVSRLRAVLKDRARIPCATQKVYHRGSIYLLPMPWEELNRQVDHMQETIQRTGMEFEHRDSNSKRASRSPCHGLATGLLRLSREFHPIAAGIFYSLNVFDFPCPTSAWMQLHAYLSTIGLQNVAHLQYIRIHVPLWHRGTHEDHLEGSIIDILSLQSHLKVIKTSTRDRLLSAIQHTTHVLSTTTTNLTLAFKLENSTAADYWTGRHTNDKRLVSLSDAEEFVERKRKGIVCLKEMTDALAGRCRPVLTVQPVLQCVQADKKEFRQRLVALVEEAAKYGWDVDPVLGGGW